MLYPGGGNAEWEGSNGVDGSGRDRIYRVATPNSRGQYSAAVLDELESQNEGHVGLLTSKVKQLKDVSSLPPAARFTMRECAC